MTTLNSEEITLSSDSVDWGVHLPLVSVSLYMHICIYIIFLLVDCFKWALIGNIEKRRVHSALWQFLQGGFISQSRFVCQI